MIYLLRLLGGLLDGLLGLSIFISSDSIQTNIAPMNIRNIGKTPSMTFIKYGHHHLPYGYGAHSHNPIMIKIIPKITLAIPINSPKNFYNIISIKSFLIP